jgi:hypothetical protein
MGRLYEDNDDFYHAKESYLMASNPAIIYEFISRVIEDPKSIYDGVSALKELPSKKHYIGLMKTAFFRACGFRKYELAMELALLIKDLTKDDWFEREVLDAVGLDKTPTTT